MTGEELGREDVGPEAVIFAEGDLEVDRIGDMALAGEHGHGVVEDVRATLHALVEP